MNNATNSASVLDKFAEKIDFTKLEGKPEAFYKAGLAFVENGQFDDGIIEFVKIIKTVSHQESLFVDTVKELKSMGFSSADIRSAAGIPEIEGEKELAVDSQNQKKTELSLTNWEAGKIGIKIGFIPLVFTYLYASLVFSSLIGGLYYGIVFVLHWGTAMGIPGGIIGALIGKNWKNTWDATKLGGALGTILGIGLWHLLTKLFGIEFGFPT